MDTPQTPLGGKRKGLPRKLALHTPQCDFHTPGEDRPLHAAKDFRRGEGQRQGDCLPTHEVETDLQTTVPKINVPRDWAGG